MTNETIADKYLWHLAKCGAKEIYEPQFGHVPQEVWDRIDIEMDTIVPNKFTDYILMIWDIHDFCKSPDRVREFCKLKGLTPPPDGIIPIGPGRGSVGGSIVCYCIGIHECDPLLFGLFFERFLNPERIAYPDIDWDVSQRYRHIAIAYISHIYGEEYVAQIITFGTLSVKTAIHDVLQSANVQNAIINMVKETVPDEAGIKFKDLDNNDKFAKAMQAVVFPNSVVNIDRQNAMKILISNVWKCGDQEYDSINWTTLMGVANGVCQQGELQIKSSWDWEKALNIMKRIEGLNKNESTHSAGVVVAPVKLDENIPLMRKDKKNDADLPVCQYDMKSIEELGYLKMDALGLRTVDVNHNAEVLVRKWYEPEFNMKNIPLNDKKTIKLIRDGDTIGIFQVESTGFTQMMQQLDIGGFEVQRFADRKEEILSSIEKLRGLEINDFMWIAAGVALYRPGPLDAVVEGKTMVQHLIDRKLGKEPLTYLFPEEKIYLEETYGILVYQEQVMARVRAMTGCTLGRADILRKAMGKKNEVLMKEQMDWFKKSAMEYEFTTANINKQAIVDRAANEIETFARYGFNKAHSVEYAINTYRSAYYKANYPTAFYASILNSETGDPKRQTVLIRDMLKHDIELLPPTINLSEAEFTMTDANIIRFGLSAIKNVGKNAIVSIFKDREERGQYKSVNEFRARIPAVDCTKVGMTNLAKCGAFDEFVGEGKKYKNRATLVNCMDDLCKAIGKLGTKKKEYKPTVDDILLKLSDGSGQYSITPVEEDLIEYSVWEKEILKYYISAHPIDTYVDEIRRWNAVEDEEIEDLDTEFYIAGFVENVHETVIKKEGRNKGKSMGFVTIGTAYRTYEATMFPGIYESCLPYLIPGHAIVLKGKKEFYKEQWSVQAAYVRNLIAEGIRDCPECHIRLNNPQYLDIIGLKGMFDQHPGLTKVFIHTINGHNDITIQCEQTIALNDRIIDYCESIGRLAYKSI